MAEKQPSINDLNHVKSKSLAIMLTMIVVFVGSFILIDFLKLRSELANEKLTVSKKVNQLFQSEKSRLVSFLSTRVKCHLASPLAKDAMEQQDREATYRLAKTKFDILKSKNPHVTHMHFYAPDGTSLVRVHNKDAYGDKISEKRPMVAYAVKNKVSVWGFEEGIYGLVFRVVEPAYNAEGQYIGSLGFGLQPQYFETVIKELFPDMKVALAISKESLSIYKEFGQVTSFNDHYVFGEDIDLLKPYIHNAKFDTQKAVSVAGRNHILIDDIVLNDFAGSPFIKMYLLKDVHELENKFMDNLYFMLSMGLLLLALLWYSARFVLNYFTGHALRLSNELVQSHQKMESVFSASKDGLAILDSVGNFVQVNQAFCSITEVSVDELKEMTWGALFSQQGLDYKHHDHDIVQCKTYAGNDKTIELKTSELSEQALFVVSCRDISLLRTQQLQIDNYLKVVDENVITSKTDLDGYITYVSEAFCKTSGYSKAELIGKKHSIVRHKDMPVELYQALWKTLVSGKTWQGEIKNRRKDGSFYWVSTVISPDFDDHKNIIGYTAIRQDITDKKQVETLSITDELTGLYNRRHYNDVFETEFSRRQREGMPFLFVLLDLDYFKKYNDTYGHQKGDEVLAKFASCLKGCFKRSGDIVFRMGGEEFAAILQIKEASDAPVLLERINVELELLNIEHTSNVIKPCVTVSLGACLITDFSKPYREEQIYRVADEALYEVKAKGRDQWVLKAI